MKTLVPLIWMVVGGVVLGPLGLILGAIIGFCIVANYRGGDT